MAFFDRFRHGRSRDAPAPEAKAAETAPGTGRGGSLLTLVRRNLSSVFTSGNVSLQNSEIIFSAVTRLANAFSAMPIQLYKDNDPIKNELNDLMSNAPNPNMSASTFQKTMEACKNTTGNAYALRTMNVEIETTRIDILDPYKVMPMMDMRTRELWYRVDTGTSKPLLLHNYYILHIPFVSTDGLVGINPTSVLFNSLQYAAKIQEFSTDQLDKGINPAIALEAPTNLSEEQRSSLVDTFTKVYKESGGNILLLESGVQAKPLNISPVDTKLLEIERITRSRVAIAYNIPPHLLGDYSGTSFASTEQQMLEFLTLTMVPIVRAYEQEFDRKLLTTAQRMEGYRWKIKASELLRADAKTMADVNYKAVRSAWKTPNEIRSEDGKPPKDNGDSLLISRDMIPLEVTVKRPELLLTKGARTSE